MKKKVLVVDLDGTLYSVNTFHHFIKFLINHCFNKFDVLLLSRVIIITLFRGLKLVSHSKMKYIILKGIMNKTNIDYQKFVNNISVYKRSISAIREDTFDIEILATAAPLCYSNIIAQNEGFDVCLGTDFPLSGFNEEFENIKEIKKNAVLNYLISVENYDFDTFITDHLDDIPLMKYANKNILICPSSATLKEVEKQLISFKIMH